MNGKTLRILALLLCVALLLSMGAAAFAEAMDASEPDTHTVTYLVQEPLSGVWMAYLSEQVRHGYLAKGAASGPMNPTGLDTEVFIGWYEDEEYVSGPVNLLRTPITADTSLHARFGDPADAPDFEGIALEIRFIASVDGELATITAKPDGIPEDVGYDLQWQNDQSGEFDDIPGETGLSVTFPMTEENASCEWRVRVAF